MGDNINMEKVHFTDKQSIEITKSEYNGRILDIGGGGEGIIGQLYGEQVVAIDPIKRELEEAPKNGSLKIVMDGKDLKFLDNDFDVATSFFTMMYIKKDDKEKVFKEIYRVLKPGGEFLLWDTNIPEAFNNEKEIYAVLLEIKIEDKTIETGYGTKWPGNDQDINLYEKLGEKVGFKAIEQKTNEDTFFIRFKK